VWRDSRSSEVRSDIVVDAGDDLNFGSGENLYDLTNDPSSLGGTWEGPGITGNNFNPSIAGLGAHIITYSFSDDVGCEAIDTRRFIVNELPSVDAGPNTTVCSTFGDIDLSTSVFPSGGTWTGAGITGDDFDPAIVGAGVYDLTYTYTNFEGCSNSAIRTITVTNPPSVDAGDPLIVCVGNPFIDLDVDVSTTGDLGAVSE